MEFSFIQSDKMYEDKGIETGNEQIKSIILETDPILFGITFVVSILHSIFEILAVKNDI